jgi:hypothetical protein
METETFMDRLLKERNELEDRSKKLEAFINGEKFATIETIQQSLLVVQLQAMKTYLRCLYERITFLNRTI